MWRSVPSWALPAGADQIEEAKAMIREAVELLVGEADEAQLRRRSNRGGKMERVEMAHA